MDDNTFHGRELDASRPSAARIYHYLLTGEAPFGVDRLEGDRLIEITPGADVIAHANRAFLTRAVTYMARHGIGQFLDIGSGFPAAGNTHEIARTIVAAARTVYVDNDLDAVERSHDLLAGQQVLDTTAIISEDLRRPHHILDHPTTTSLLDFTAPIGVLLVAVWHFVPDTDHPRRIMAALRDRLPPGSYIAISHAATELDHHLPGAATGFATAYNERVADSITFRDRAAVTALFDGFSLVEPGVTWLPDWHPDHLSDPADPCHYAGHAGIAILGHPRPRRR
ncbi:SAM-dependent methyltransferase [Nocardia sp. alder85J]|uniref:SAM-dependent methyltransferase n=1 Tax=Nocardia sp. alder85J TaxID=2862949 RepID=UPI001CD29E62|nr:SAM-dependent methyltransferase [Nocardia sp. alder85J]MCX4097737.1 SAM-dependent methyltransferase [Nocardia sp. alder85J]